MRVSVVTLVEDKSVDFHLSCAQDGMITELLYRYSPDTIS